MSTNQKSSNGNQPATKYRKPRNARALIHDWANGTIADATVGNVSMSNHATFQKLQSTSVNSYALRIAHRIELNRKVTIVRFSGNQSVTTRKHMGWLLRSIPFPIVNKPSNLGESILKRFENGEFETICQIAIKHEFAEIRKDAHAEFKPAHKDCFLKPLVIDLEGIAGAMLNPLTHAKEIYQSYCGQISKMLLEAGNKRIKRFPVYEIASTVLAIEKAKEFRKRFCPSIPAIKFPKAEKILSDYLIRHFMRERKRIIAHETQVSSARLWIHQNMDFLNGLRAEGNEIDAQWTASVKEHFFNYQTPSWEIAKDFRGKKNSLVYKLKEVLAPRKIELNHVLEIYRDVNGNGLSFYTEDSGHFLRLSKSGEEIETSGGAQLPVSLCSSLWKRFGSIFSRIEQGEDVSQSLPIALGHFTFAKAENGVCHVGCHRIHAKEFNSLANRLGWTS